jgi:hypothetical protein
MFDLTTIFSSNWPPKILGILFFFVAARTLIIWLRSFKVYHSKHWNFSEYAGAKNPDFNNFHPKTNFRRFALIEPTKFMVFTVVGAVLLFVAK